MSKAHIRLETFGSRLRWVREQYGLSLAQFGQRFNVTRSYLSKLERGAAVNPSTDIVDSICGLYRVREKWLLEGEGMPFVDDLTNDLANKGKLSPPLQRIPLTSKQKMEMAPLYVAASVVKVLSVGQLAHALSGLLNEHSLDDPFIGTAASIYVDELAKRLKEWEASADIQKAIPSEQQSTIGKTYLTSNVSLANQDDVKIPEGLWPKMVGRLRKLLGPSGKKTQFARDLGVTRQTVHRWLNVEEAEPSGDLALRIQRWIQLEEKAK